MQYPDYDYLMVMERRRDELAEAQNSRLVKEARRINPGQSPARRLRRLAEALMLSIAQSLSSIGGWLLNLSCRLETRVALFKKEATEQQPSPCS